MLKWVQFPAESEGLEIPFRESLIKLNPFIFYENFRDFSYAFTEINFVKP